MPRVDVSLRRTTPPSWGVARTVPPMTYRSYCSVTQRREHSSGEPAMASTVAPSSAGVDGRSSPPVPAALSASCSSSGRAIGRW